MVETPQKTANKMVTPTGFEPVTVGLEIRCSIQLSYGALILEDRIIQFFRI